CTQIRVRILDGSDPGGLLAYRNGFAVTSRHNICAAQVAIAASVVWSQLDDLGEHLRGLVVACPAIEESTQPAVARPIFRTGADSPPISVFGFCHLRQMLVGEGQSAVSVVIGMIGPQDLLKFRRSLFVPTGAVVHRAQAVVAEASGVRSLASLQRF